MDIFNILFVGRPVKRKYSKKEMDKMLVNWIDNANVIFSKKSLSETEIDDSMTSSTMC